MLNRPSRPSNIAFLRAFSPGGLLINILFSLFTLPSTGESSMTFDLKGGWSIKDCSRRYAPYELAIT